MLIFSSSGIDANILTMFFLLLFSLFSLDENEILEGITAFIETRLFDNTGEELLLLLSKDFNC